MEIARTSLTLALSDQGQGQRVTLKFFSIYHNTNCQVLCLSFGTWQEAVIKCMCSSGNYMITTFINIIMLE